MSEDSPQHLFVYGTLRPGEARWPFLQPYVVDEGAPDAVLGHLYDTGLGYPAAMFHPAAEPTESGGPAVRGRTYGLRIETLAEALHALDEVEGAVRGLYCRVIVETTNGVTAWTYQYGTDPADPHIALTPIAGGDWLGRS